METVITKDRGNRELPFNSERLKKYVLRVAGSDDETYLNKVITTIENREKYSAKGITDLLINTALENIDESEPDWTFVASKIYIESLYKEASVNRAYSAKDKYGDFYGLQKVLAGKGIYSHHILEKYTREEIQEASKLIIPERDYLLNYSGVHLLADRYLAKGYDREVYELPQERFLVIAMYLMQDEEKNKRMKLIEESYWALSNLYMTVATPTLANAGLSYGQLSSCFIDTVGDSLLDIYNSNTDVANLSKNGAGIGMYLGKVRARGSSIKGIKGASSGVVPWVRQINNTAISVDQLGKRAGSIAVYLDVWHSDIESFLDLKLNNGDERMRARDIFPGVCLPDLFMEQVEKRGDWYLFDPHEVREVMGYDLADFYDEEKGNGTFRLKYEECIQDNRLSKRKIPAIEIMKRIMISQLETGTPFMFYRDEVNRMNANKHEGMIYCTNLCVEITQNQSITEFVEDNIDEDGFIITKKKPGDFVTCNLSSINLGRAVPHNILERLIPIQVRMLDNVIDLNTIPVKQAVVTNERYRAIGLGTFGLHHLLALKGIHWETDEAVNYNDKLYEKIAFLTIKASMELADEKDAYPLFEGSEWQTGEYFSRRNYFGDESMGYDHSWDELRHHVKEIGVRNGYMMAVAPNGSTATLAGSTASIDPIFNVFFYEEKKDSKVPIVAPDLNYKTYEYYKRSAYVLDQRKSVEQNAARQRHIDQSISFNIYVPNDISAKHLLNLHLQAWRSGLKTSYYVRSTTTSVDECEWCT